MAEHICKECTLKFVVSKRGRPPALCDNCKNKSTVLSKVELPVEQSLHIELETTHKSEEFKFEVFVSNLGSAYKGSNKKIANEIYEKYVAASIAGYGQVGREKVSLITNGNVEKDFDPYKQ